MSLDDGRAADPKTAGSKAKGTGKPNKSTGKKSSVDTTALRAERSRARRAAIAREDAFGAGTDDVGSPAARGATNGNSSGGSAFGGSTFGLSTGPSSGSAMGSAQSATSMTAGGNTSGTGSSSSTATSSGNAAAAAGTGTQGGSGTTGGQGQTGTGSTAIPTLNQRVLDFAIANLGKQVGNGECWELGAEALAAAGAEPPQGQVFGSAVPLTSMLPGDILEFYQARFVGANYWLALGGPYHTAIVSDVQGTSVAMLNQNINNVKLVQVTIIHLTDLRSGTITVYRPMARQQQQMP
jgi:hypothetical protein